MSVVYSPGNEHETFTQWAKDQGITIHGVAPARFEGKGLGLVAARDIAPDELLISIPTRALITIDSEAVRKVKFPRRSTVHGRLAAYLTIQNSDPNREHKLWQAVWPTMKDFEQSMPFCWSLELQELLPPSAMSILKKQQKKFQSDLDDMKSFLPPSSEDIFKYFWLTISTRVFYWDYQNTPPARLPKKRTDLVPDDCLALCPFADYFNHTDVGGCIVSTDRKGLTVRSLRAYKASEEVFICYGGHSNDFLLTEYGFMLPQNSRDSVTLDHLILPKLTRSQKETLEGGNFLGNYSVSHIDSKRVACMRTQAALRLVALPEQRYYDFISGEDDGEKDQTAIDEALRKLYAEYIAKCQFAVIALEKVDGDEASRAATLVQRWKDIESLLKAA